MRNFFIALYICFVSVVVRAVAPAELQTAYLYTDVNSLSGVFSSLCQDHDGFIWIGTDRGLLRFDGNSYDIYRHDDNRPGSLSDSRVLDVMCDSKGRVWVATANGLNLYHSTDDTFEPISIPSKNFLGYIIAMTEQPDGTVTFVVSGVGVYVVDDKSSHPAAVKYGTGYEDQSVNTIVAGPSGRLYMGTDNGGLYVMARNGKMTRYTVADGVYIKAISIESDGNLLIAVYGMLFRFYTSTGELKHLEADGLTAINDLSNSSGSDVFVVTEGRGVWKVSAGSDIVVQCTGLHCPFLDIQTAVIGASYSAPDGNLWLGCNYRGVVMVTAHPEPFVYRKFSEYFPDFAGGFSAMGVWKGNVLIGIDKGRIAMVAPEGSLLLKANIPVNGNISHIYVEGDKAIVSVAYDGVWELDLKTGALGKMIDIPGIYTDIEIAPGRPGEYFVAVHGMGVMRYDRNTGERVWLPVDPDGDQLTNPYTACITRTPDDKIWMGLFGGIACYDLKIERLLHIDQQPFLKGATFSIEPCLTDNSVWAGTSHGLIHFDPEEGVIDKLTISKGISDNDVRSIARDNNGGKWVGTMNGVSYVPSSNDRVNSYFGGHGLVDRSINRISFSPDNNTMYLGSDLGITTFCPDSIKSFGFDNPVRVSGIYLNGKRLMSDTEINGHKVVVKGTSLYPEELYLPSSDNALTLRVSTMDFRDASNITYMWRLGKDEEWIRCSPGDNLIYLPHLDPGTYHLEICAQENNEISPSASIKIRIATPWIQSWWMKLAVVALLLLLLVLALRLLKKKRDQEVNEDKIKMFTDISHDIRSPITLILNPLETLMKEVDTPAHKSKLDVMRRNAHRILSLVDQMLDVQKLEKGKMLLSCRKTDINEFVKGLVQLFHQQALEKDLKLVYSGCDTLGDIWLDRDNFDKILVNLISNAIKYTPAGGNIEVRLDEALDDKLGRCARVSVIDTGIGLDAKTQTLIFERFYRVRNDHEPGTAGFGIGLDLCRRLVTLHHGSISCSNRDDAPSGSVFSVLIPVDESLYAESEKVHKPSAPAEQMAHLGVHESVGGSDVTARSKPASAGQRILVVDDDAELRNYIKGELQKYYVVKDAPDGSDALRLAAEWKPDVVVSDVMMAGMDGLTLLKRLKSAASTNHIPVVLLSSKIELADRMAGWEKGADAYLGKPFNMDELISVIDTLIENRRRMRGKFSGAQETEGKIDAPEMKGNDQILLERIQKVINKNIDDPQFNVESLADEVGVSRAQLHRKMKELLGLTPSDYIRNIRLSRACELLKRPDIEVTQVAYQIGFASQPHFSSHFKKYTGFSPSEFRARSMSNHGAKVKSGE